MCSDCSKQADLLYPAHWSDCVLSTVFTRPSLSASQFHYIWTLWITLLVPVWDDVNVLGLASAGRARTTIYWQCSLPTLHTYCQRMSPTRPTRSPTRRLPTRRSTTQRCCPPKVSNSWYISVAKASKNMRYLRQEHIIGSVNFVVETFFPENMCMKN